MFVPSAMMFQILSNIYSSGVAPRLLWPTFGLPGVTSHGGIDVGKISSVGP